MITYEKAIELLDAGYLQKSIWFGQESDGSRFMIGGPTLSELIEACGDGFFKLQVGSSLMGDRNVWYAYENEQTGMIGETPEEAVANLWLALNKK